MGWLDKLQELDALQSVESIKGYLDRGVESAGEEGSWGRAIAKGLLTPAYAPIHGVSAIGNLVGGAAGAIGGGLSEAGQESKNNSELLDAILSGAKGGAEAGGEAARENITALDLASLGVGAAASGAMKSAKLAGVAGRLGDAADLAKGASRLSKIDLGLSGVDAAVGGSQVATGIRDKDPLKAVMGVARVAGNTYGGIKAKQDLSFAKGFGDEARDLGKGLEEVFMGTGGVKKPKPDIYNPVLSAVDASGEKFDFVRVIEGDEKTTPGIKPKKDFLERRAERDADARERIQELKDDEEVAGVYGKTASFVRQVQQSVEQRFYSKIDRRNKVLAGSGLGEETPETAGQLYLQGKKFGGFFFGGDKGGVTWIDSAEKPVRYKFGKNKETIKLEQAPGGRFLVNVPNIAKNVSANYDALLDPTLKNFEGASEMLDDELLAMVQGVRDGSIMRTPEVDIEIKSRMLARDLIYTVFHESGGHSSKASQHEALGLSDYRRNFDNADKTQGVHDHTGQVGIPKEGDPISKPDVFSNFQNEISSSLRMLKTEYPEIQAILDSPVFRNDMKRMYMTAAPYEDVDKLFQSKVAMKSDRPVGRVEARAAADEFKPKGEAAFDEPGEYGYYPDGKTPRNLKPIGDEKVADDAVKMAMTAEETDAIDARNAKIQKEIGRKTTAGEKSGNQTVWEQPTPQPEPPRFGQPLPPEDPMGENLKPLADRIKLAFSEQNRINTLNGMKNREFRHAKMQAAQDAWAKYNNREIDGKELYRRIDEARKGSHGLLTETLGMRLAPGEFEQVLDVVKQQAVKNTEERNNLAISWQKMANGERLTPGEVKNLREALKASIGDVKVNNFWEKFLRAGENAIGGSRALMSSLDLSAAGRQALYASVMNPKEAARAFKDQISALKMSREEFETYMKTLTDKDHNPFIDLAEASGLHITGPHEITAMQEEAFINPTWAEKVPGVRRTEQAYIAYLNKMRVELFNKGADNLMESGIPWQNEEGMVTQAYKDLAYMVNTLTGRGEMSLFHISPTSRMGKKMGLQTELNPGEKMMNQMHRGLTSVFFAPRFTASRAAILRDSTMALLGGNLDPKVYKMYMKNVYGTYFAQMAVVSMLVGTGVATFQADPRKQDFGNLKVGNARYDIFGGIKQWAKLFSVIGTDRYMSRTYGWREYGEGMGAKTKTEQVGKFLQGKLSPPAGFLLEALTGEDYLGRKSNVIKNAYGHMFPMIIQTVQEVVEAGEADQLAIAVPAAGLGIGVNAYKPQRGGSWKR